VGPMWGAGFMKGVGQGLIGAVAQPVSGGLEFVSSAFEGIDASSSTLIGRQRNPRSLQRRRLPRAIGGDSKVQPLLRMDGNVMTDRQVCSDCNILSVCVPLRGQG
jgi:hypothetical protein